MRSAASTCCLFPIRCSLRGSSGATSWSTHLCVCGYVCIYVWVYVWGCMCVCIYIRYIDIYTRDASLRRCRCKWCPLSRATTHIYAHAAVAGRHHLLDAGAALADDPADHGRGQLHDRRLSSILVFCVGVYVHIYECAHLPVLSPLHQNLHTKPQPSPKPLQLPYNGRTGFSRNARGMTEGKPPPGPTTA